MNPSIPNNMKAAVIDRFGGPEVLHVATIPVPELSEHEVLIRVNTAGVGVWDRGCVKAVPVAAVSHWSWCLMGLELW